MNNMNERFHTPPHTLDIQSITPLIFLAGPVQGARDWQTPTADKLLVLRDDIDVASPRRRPQDEKRTFTRTDSIEQVEWEDITLARSAHFGSIMIWLAAQDHALPYKEGRAYAQTTRLETGEAWGWLGATQTLTGETPFPLLVGIDPRYTDEGGGSESYIRIKHAIKKMPVYDSLDQMIEQAAEQTPFLR